MYHYGLIGNCQISALVNHLGSIDWLSLPRPDSPPVFGKLLDSKGGAFSVEGIDIARSNQRYLPNTNVLVTEVFLKDGSAFQITDFCPRFNQYGRVYRPISLFRIVERTQGNPTVRIRCNPVSGWEKAPLRPTRGNSHLRWDVRGAELRLTTNMSLTYLTEEIPFVLEEPLYFGLTWSLGIEDDLRLVSLQFLEQTIDYWRTWVKHCTIPTHYQKETIRSALALKLHCYEDTGAILAALTTSLPEEPGATRNWDYRFCWLRDAYYVLSALRNLGHFEEMEGFLKFLLGIAHHYEHSKDRLRPVYGLDQSLPLPEYEHSNWEGFMNSKPVRSFNQAADHVQNDVYGEMILTLTPIFLDERFHHLRTKTHEDLIGHLAKFCISTIAKPDAGLWEIRDGWQEHSFSNLMNWAGIDRVMRIQKEGYLKDLKLDLQSARLQAESALQAAVAQGVLTNGPKDRTLDASLLQLPILRYPNEKISDATITAIMKDLCMTSHPDHSGFVYRYKRNDDFGSPQSAFVVCSFWLVQALASIGRMPEAKRVMGQVLAQAPNSLGLLSEHYLPETNLQSGNFPQAYSHVGLINAAFAISPSWEQIL